MKLMKHLINWIVENNVHFIKPRLPIVNVGRGQCPHNHEFDMHFIIKDKEKDYNCYYCRRCVEAIEDWNKMKKDEYYEKYPELKPLSDPTQNKVILDEADKKK